MVERRNQLVTTLLHSGGLPILDGAIRPLAVARRRCYAGCTSLIVNRPGSLRVSNMGCLRTTRPRGQNSDSRE